MLELLVVLLIISFMSALVAPTIGSSISNLKLKTVSKKISAALRYARNRAVFEKATYLITFDLDKNRLSVAKKVKELGGVKGSADPDSKIYDLPEGIKIQKAISYKEEVDSGLFQLVFYHNGSSSGGTIIIMETRGKYYNIEVDFITGIVKLNGDKPLRITEWKLNPTKPVSLSHNKWRNIVTDGISNIYQQ
jgi:Tfp pilus assembly protein FimT